MLDNVTVTFSGPPSAISQLLATVTAMQGSSGPGATVKDQPYSAPNSGALVSLNRDQFAAFFEGMDPGYQEGVRLIAEKGGSVSWPELRGKGIRNPGHFKSRTSLRARSVLGSSHRVQFASYFYRIEDGEEVWYLRATPTTLTSMRAYFAAKKATKSARKGKGN